ncbi:MAG: response regulator [Desulfuromonadales bacterium]|nr:response regulator [Desulfuromonadales bacterium]
MERIIVVDDESSIRLLYSQELADEGYIVDTSATIAEAVGLLGKNSYDVVILDIKLKNESGLDLLQKIVKEKNNMLVILSTAFSCYKDDFSAWLADSYIVKSGDLKELKDEIKRLLESRKEKTKKV